MQYMSPKAQVATSHIHHDPICTHMLGKTIMRHRHERAQMLYLLDYREFSLACQGAHCTIRLLGNKVAIYPFHILLPLSLSPH